MTAPAATPKLTRPTYGRSAPLPPRRHPWIRNTGIVLATAAGVTTMAPMLGVGTGVAATAVAGLVLTAAGVAVDGYHRQQRQQDIDRCAEQLCAVLGLAPTRAVLWAREWGGAATNRWGSYPTRPRRIVVRYTNAGTELDPDWLARVNEVISGQPWGTYRLERHNRRRCRLVYVLDNTPAPTPDPESTARGKRLILKLLGPTAVITDATFDDTGTPTRIEARHDDGARFAPSGYRDRIERTVSALLPGRWRAVWDLVADTVVFEIRPTFPKVIWHDTISNPDTPYEKVEVAYGQDEDRNVQIWRPCIDPHFIFIGATGTGKTAAVHTVLTDLAARGWMCWVVDGKGMEFIGFQTWPNVQIVAARMEHQVAVIHRAWEEMEARYAAIADGASEDDFTPLCLVIDEFADFKGNLENWYSLIKVKGDPSQPRTLIEVASLVRKGRTARIHLVFSTQRPDADFFSGRGRGDTRDSLRMRVSLGPLSPQGAMMMWNSPTVGTTIPRGIRGRATGITADNRPVEIQCFYTPDPRRTTPGDPSEQVLQKLRPARTLHERLVILPPDEDDEDDIDPELPQPRRRAPVSVFRQIVTARWGWASDHPNADPVRRRAALVAARDTDPEPHTLLGLSDLLGRRATSAAPVDDLHDPQVAGEDDTPPVGRSMAALLAAAATAGHRPRLRLLPTPEPEDDEADSATEHNLPPADSLIEADEFSDYDDPVVVRPLEVSVGDLIYDDATDTWGVVDGEPEPDLLAGDDSLIAITYRTETDEEEMLSIPDSGEVTIRRPLGFDDPST